jgi:hypothetical protein
MWLWLASGWVVAAVAAALVHHRWRQQRREHSPEVAAFGLRLENELLAAHRDVEFLGMLPDRFACLLRVDGQETAVSLHEVFHRASGDDDAFTRLIATLVAEIREVGLDQVGDRDFAAVAPLLMPQVRARPWLDAQGTFGDSGLVHTPLTEGLVTVYVVDDPTTMVFVCREHLRRWRKNVADVDNLARQNLARRGAAPTVAPLGEPVLVRSGDGFDAARVLLLGDEDGLLVAMPDRDTLWVGRDNGHNLEQLMATTEAVAAAAAHPVSPRVYRLTDGQLEALPNSR